MSELILYRGNDHIDLELSKTPRYLYQIGGGEVAGGTFIELNDAARLNRIAEEVRDLYTKWVYSLNDRFLNSNLIIDGLSLFFISDLSCKRSEFFDTYDSICTLLLLREKLGGEEVSHARLIGIDEPFAVAFRSFFPNVRVRIERKQTEKTALVRRLVSDLRYIVRTLGVIGLNWISASPQGPVVTRRKFLSFFPAMFDKTMKEVKYGTLVGQASEFAVTVLADGMHQNASLKEYFCLSRAVERKGMYLVDRCLRVSDVWIGLVWGVKLWGYFFSQRGGRHVFGGIDISGFIRRELRFSISRIVRLLIIKGAVFKFLKETRPDELYYYPVEYPFGRMVSWISTLATPSTQRIGFQMGIVSQRRIEQFMAADEGSVVAPFTHQVPIPDRVLAEGPKSASVYRYAGYQGVEIMDRVYRYEYLSRIRPEKRKSVKLIALGLHDGPTLLNTLSRKILRDPEQTWIIKPHPRSRNEFLETWQSVAGVKISAQPIEELLSIASEVYVTYGSVGLEASALGLNVHIIDIPGRVNASPLLDDHDVITTGMRPAI